MKSFVRHLLMFVSLTVIMFPGRLAAQLNQGGIPSSFSLSMAPDESGFVTISPPATDRLLLEDEQSPLPYRFAVNLPVDLDIKSTGHWEKTVDGTNIWRLSLSSPGALALTLYFDRFDLPKGGKLFVYNPRRTQCIGAFTSLNNSSLQTFATGLIYGDQLTLEYDAPDGLPVPLIHISEVAHAYRGVADHSTLKTGFGAAGKCQVNVNCSEGGQWYNQKRGVARMEIKKGTSTAWCTGSLVNNTRNDGKPYILTADHCGYSATAADISMWIVYFDYESAACPNPTSEPSSQSMTGATLVARSGGSAWSGSDFFMVLLNESVPASFNAYFNGWSREGISSPSGVGIHHPEGDIKKISTYVTPLRPAHYPGNPDLIHWQVNWTGTTNGHGTTEGGSSGSPIFDNLGRVMGTLTGGDSSCDSARLGLPDFYGMFSYHWDQNGSEPGKQLKPWLDPINSGVLALNGWALSVDEPQTDEWISIYPNPATDRLTIRMNSQNIKSFGVSMTDLYGNLVQKLQFNATGNQEHQLNLAGLNNGMYLIRVTDGVQSVVRKIIKE